MTGKKEFERIFRQHYGEMYRLACRMLGDEAEGKDVVSDVFAHLLHSHTDLRAATLRAFLLTNVRNRCASLLARRQREQAAVVELDCCRQDPSPEDGSQDRLDALRRYIDTQLPQLSQQVLRLRYQQGLKYREIAAALGVSEVTVHNHLSHSLQQLKNHFKKSGYGIE